MKCQLYKNILKVLIENPEPMWRKQIFKLKHARILALPLYDVTSNVSN